MGALILLSFSLIMPLLLMVSGHILYSREVPRQSAFGYRTHMAMINDDTWEFANRLFGKKVFRLGVIEIIICVLMILYCTFIREPESPAAALLVTEALELFAFIYPCAGTEEALRLTFDRNGKRKHL
ncbi:MAG: SdpI family protein [Ruminococcus sp.]|nr:SdpI family protein [Ruminococcus sp.]